MCTIGEVSSESGSEQEPSALDPVHVAYTAGKLVKNLFDPVMFAKYNGWKNDTMKDWAKEYLHDGVKESVKDLNGKNRAKAKLLNIKRNVERLKLYDWNSEASAWQQHWETLEIQRTLRHNKLKRAFAIDSEMTEGLQGLSRAHTVTKKNKQDHWEQGQKTIILWCVVLTGTIVWVVVVAFFQLAPTVVAAGRAVVVAVGAGGSAVIKTRADALVLGARADAGEKWCLERGTSEDNIIAAAITAAKKKQ